MIKTTVRFQFQEMGGVVAVVAFSVRRRMKLGLTDGRYAVVAFAAISIYFQMINKVDIGKSCWCRCMTGRAPVTGSDVIQRFTRNRTKLVVMTVHAVR